MPFVLIITMLRGWFKAALALWNALPRPVRLAIILVLCMAFAFWRGMVSERVKCEARIQASIASARKMDDAIAVGAAGRRATQQADEALRSAADKREISSYVEELAKRTADACRAGDDAGRINDGLGLSDEGGIPEPRPEAPAGRHDRAKPGKLPARKGE